MACDVLLCEAAWLGEVEQSTVICNNPAKMRHLPDTGLMLGQHNPVLGRYVFNNQQT